MNDVEHPLVVDGSFVNFTILTKGHEVGQEATVNTPAPMGFFAKFFELQGLMISHNSGLTKPHPYSSSPMSWPFMTRGISFWCVILYR